MANTTFRINDHTSFGEAVNLLWQVFELGEGAVEVGGQSAFDSRRCALKDANFLVPVAGYDLSQDTLYYSRVAGTLTRNLLRPRRDWRYQKGIVSFRQGDTAFDYSAPIRRGMVAKMIINTMLYRTTIPTNWGLTCRN